MTSQLVILTSQLVIFGAFFFVPPILNLKKNPINQLINNSGLKVSDM